MSTPHRRSYADVARIARAEPERWVLLRTQTSATLVTRIRSGAVAEFADGYEARCAMYESQGRTVYDIEVRWVGEQVDYPGVPDDFTFEEVAYALTQPDVRQAVRAALRGRDRS